MRNKIKNLLREFEENKNTAYDEIYSLPYNLRSELQNQLEMLVSADQTMDLEEIEYGGIPELKSSGNIFNQISKWFKRYLTDKASDFLINASADEMQDTIKMLKVLDPKDMNGIFEPRAMYLGGGIDFATDALSWRTKVEDYFGEGHVVKGTRLLDLVTTGTMDFKGLETPAILNPLRAETVRDEDEEFQNLFKAWKANKLTGEQFEVFREKIREQIVVQDLYMLKVCDTNLINFDGTAGAGTFGEAQVSALKNSQVFIWLTNGMKISNISPWMMPSITKILQEDELFPFLANFK
jgi:hypothetical protein|tara:strand:- start:3508 stop:4392 length:885 start_codon:yes stop_codon:yes gene_type:complete